MHYNVFKNLKKKIKKKKYKKLSKQCFITRCYSLFILELKGCSVK